MTMKQAAIKAFAEYFQCTEEEARDLNHMTIDCMVKFAEIQCKITARNVRHKAVEVSNSVCQKIDDNPAWSLPSHLTSSLERNIMNIQYNDVKPKQP